jgi:biotin carboxylase
LVTGPIHVEVRFDSRGEPYLLEVAARSIGGLCSRALTFGMLGESLEILILRSALGWQQATPPLRRPAAGVLMLPIPSSGVFLELEGTDRARLVPGIDDLEITVSSGSAVRALPEGSRYLGFVFASGEAPDAVEQSLREAAAALTVVIDGEAVDPLVGQPWARD